MEAAVELVKGDRRATVLPGVGGALADYSAIIGGRRIDLLRAAEPPSAIRSVLELACFPLVPYSNRIRQGRFRFADREIRLPLNFGAHPHSIHGHGWQRPWAVVSSGAGAVTLEYRHAPDAWPWAYRARQAVVLDESGLALELSVTNLAELPMPVGLGFHPYFPRAGSARLGADVSSVWLVDDEMMPTARAPLPGKWNLPSGVAVARMACDNCFEGWDGTARIDWPELGIGLDLTASSALARLVVYAPAGEAFFCVEPVSHMTDAFNRAADGATDSGMRTLEPGETASAWMRLAPRGS